MQTRRILCLTQTITFTRSTAWEFHSRYALQRGRQEIPLPAGTWLVELDPIETWPGQDIEYPYRLPTGEVVVRGSPLVEHHYTELTDPQIVAAMNAYRSTETILADEFGVSLHRICRDLPPFALIQCPLCSGTSFTTVDLASVRCDRCNAAFQVRSTAGDPGFIVDITWVHYNPLAAHYVIPRTEKLRSTLVLKDSGDPRDMSCDHCSDRCKAGAIQLTDGRTGLRLGLHRCNIGTLYDWRHIYGRVPTPGDLFRAESWEIDGQVWPASAALRVLPLSHSERSAMKRAMNIQQEERRGIAGEIEGILRFPTQSPSVFEAVLPDVRNLQGEERYLLHHWLAAVTESVPGGHQTALPVWYVVTPIVEDHHFSGWKVLRKDICPICGNPVSPEEAARFGERSEWDLPHRACREIWEMTGWQPSDPIG